MKNSKLLIISICLLACKGHPKTGHPYDHAYYDELSRRQSEIFATLPEDTSDIIFLGTSLTAGYYWSELNPRIKNRGIPGNTTYHMLARSNFKGRTVFIEAGLNDIIAGVPVDTFMINLRRLAAKFPTVYVYTIFPTFGQYRDLNPVIRQFNDSIKRTFPNLITIPFDSTMSYDGAHPNAKGYQSWSKALAPYIENISSGR